jgi:hypothetical protein
MRGWAESVNGLETKTEGRRGHLELDEAGAVLARAARIVSGSEATLAASRNEPGRANDGG